MAKRKFSERYKHPAALALDEWLESPEGITCQCGNTSGPFLINRLVRAFQAGYLACEKRTALPTGPS